ncbi:MAG TPA: hypothetical protein VHZ03_01255 [Trebonia sp.]|nr:hypothetical protein [Trebonia sp.]
MSGTLSSKPHEEPAPPHQIGLAATSARARDKPGGAEPLDPVLASVADQKIEVPL